MVGVRYEISQVCAKRKPGCGTTDDSDDTVLVECFRTIQLLLLVSEESESGT